MVCPKCGNEDVNEMLVEFEWDSISQGTYIDTTTLPKLLYYLTYPKDVGRMSGRDGLVVEPKDGMLHKIRMIYCNKCVENKQGRVEIKPTRYGI